MINFAPLEKHSNPKEPVPEKRSSTLEFNIDTLNLFECCIRLKIDSFTRSLRGIVFLSSGR